jgi:hypothetical protein
MYQLPGNNISNRLLRAGVGGWQLNAITTFESGAPTTVTNGYTSSFDYMGDVPDRVCNGNLSRGQRTFTRHFDTDCYVNPLPDPNTGIALHRGDERRNNLVGPGISNWDTSVNKDFPLYGEGTRLQFRAESFNTFNHTQWSKLNTTDDREVNPASQFGYVTEARPGRHMQFALKILF